MATVTPFIRTLTKGKDVNIRFRLRDGRTVSLFHASEIKINPTYWDKDKGELKAKLSEITIPKAEKERINKAIQVRKAMVLEAYLIIQKQPNLSSKLLDVTIDKLLNPSLYTPCNIANGLLFNAYKTYLNDVSLEPSSLKNHKSVNKMLVDFADERGLELTLENTSADTLKDFEQWLTNKGCAMNTIAAKLKRIRAFYNYANKVAKWTLKNPFIDYKAPTELYGTPLMLTIAERNYLRDAQIDNERLARVRDLFILQCLIGCRVGDFFTMRKENIINGTIEYIAEKTKKENAKTIKVPLSTTAKQIIERYNYPDGLLMPFISDVKYNLYLKELFAYVGLTRPTSWLNPKSRKQEIKPLNELVSSHMARRTFVGIAHKAGLKNEIIASMSGHVANSRAFERYYAIDEKQKQDAINLID
jgi:site-specific recombinase XerD